MQDNENKSSIKSDFQFLAYKIDRINFSLEPIANAVIYKQTADAKVEIGFAVRDIGRVTNNEKKQYMCGLDTQLKLYDNDKLIATGVFGIEGLFLVDGHFKDSQENQIVKFQFPTILFPYLRSAITNILASAGFGSIVFPLINVYNLVENQDKKNKINIIDLREAIP
ncbi:protein-export chaperone SecB [Treponema putidum]|uniref:protein-export chaperone SecB n=1 Tax=Treponema putidum TaxID=221027 RepID=UPI002104F71C|nr:protein-export chaperone SecB [Treponema putidum]UTY31750.1 hypothetical protein E4N75_09830 [Treponema putidum]